MTTTATINPAILDVYTMTQNFDAETAKTLFSNTLKANYDLSLETSSVEEFEEFNLKVYAKSAVERTASRIAEDTMIFKVEEIKNYGKEDFVGKRFYQLRKWDNKFFFNDLSVGGCIHNRGFVPVSIVRTEENVFKAKFMNHVFGEGKRIVKSEKGRTWINHESRFDIWTDM